MPSANRRTRTVQFRVQDVRFLKNGHVLDPRLPFDVLKEADIVVLTIDNQKNGQRGETMTHHKVHGFLDPVTSLARRVSTILSLNMPLSTPLSYVTPGTHVTASMVLTNVRQAAVRSNLPAKGYNLNRIGSHSLRASGAMALRLNGYSDGEIMKIGRWRGLTFLTYIHSQIGTLTRGVSTRMTRRIEFFNVCA